MNDTKTVAMAIHARVFHCDACGRDEVLQDPITGRAMSCDQQHKPGPCRIVACLACCEEAVKDRNERQAMISRLAQ